MAPTRLILLVRLVTLTPMLVVKNAKEQMDVLRLRLIRSRVVFYIEGDLTQKEMVIPA
jgi:hypothetical protein